MDVAALNPCQQSVLSDLIDYGGERQVFDPGLAAGLRRELEDALVDLAHSYTARQPFVISKSRLSHVSTCEGLFLGRARDVFEMTRPMAVGILTHKAVERLMVDPRRHRHPRSVARHVIEIATSDDDTLGTWLDGLDPEETAEIAGQVSNLATDFVAQWPPVDAGWFPRVESRAAAVLCADRVKLAARYDLALGKPHGMQARTLIVDLKTGTAGYTHLGEVRFYALIETLRHGVPPYRVALHSLETGGHHAEVVTEEMLFATTNWVAEGARAMHEVTTALRDPELSPGPACTWCPVRETCEPGQDWSAG
ncbi:MAG: PD-(D/E)XK nuclease family protein [Acidimicrobiia bacterium]|nr:PD-(D/E)XK nuclease family protein [Acidimicrobiia bacterium]